MKEEEENRERREEEFLAVSSIYEEVFVVLPGPEERARIEASPQLQEPVQLVLPGGDSPVHVKYLPPVTAHLKFPSTYPSSDPPYIHLVCSWLNDSQIQTVIQKLKELWEENEGEAILFIWISFLLDEVWDFLGFTDSLDLLEATRDGMQDESGKNMKDGTEMDESGMYLKDGIDMKKESRMNMKDGTEMKDGAGRNMKSGKNKKDGTAMKDESGRNMKDGTEMKDESGMKDESEMNMKDGTGMNESVTKDRIGTMDESGVSMTDRTDVKDESGEGLKSGAKIINAAEAEVKSNINLAATDNAQLSDPKLNACDIEREIDDKNKTVTEDIKSVTTEDEEGATGYATNHNNQKPIDSHGINCVNEQSGAELLLARLMEFNQKEKYHVFESSVHACQICFGDKFGRMCLMFDGCDHVFCKECIGGYFHVKIQDGEVNNLVCPAPKCETKAHPAQVQNAVSGEDFARYDSLLLRRYLGRLKDVVYCPRASCQSAVVVNNASRMGFCAPCRFSFCTMCLKPNHGMTYCVLEEDEHEKIYIEYMKMNEKEKEYLLKKYGKKQLEKRPVQTQEVEGFKEKYLAADVDTQLFVDNLIGEDVMNYYLKTGILTIKPENMEGLVKLHRLGSKSERRKLARFFDVEKMMDSNKVALSEEWLGENTKDCPECGIPIKKDGGCSHMRCQMCKTYFCWGCLSMFRCECHKLPIHPVDVYRPTSGMGTL